jgi:hypothetical protein
MNKLSPDDHERCWQCYIHLSELHRRPVSPVVYHTTFFDASPLELATALAQRGDDEGLEILIYHFGHLLPKWNLVDMLPVSVPAFQYARFVLEDESLNDGWLDHHVRQRFLSGGQISDWIALLEENRPESPLLELWKELRASGDDAAMSNFELSFENAKLNVSLTPIEEGLHENSVDLSHILMHNGSFVINESEQDIILECDDEQNKEPELVEETNPLVVDGDNDRADTALSGKQDRGAVVTNREEVAEESKSIDGTEEDLVSQHELPDDMDPDSKVEPESIASRDPIVPSVYEETELPLQEDTEVVLANNEAFPKASESNMGLEVNDVAISIEDCMLPIEGSPEFEVATEDIEGAQSNSVTSEPHAEFLTEVAEQVVNESDRVFDATADSKATASTMSSPIAENGPKDLASPESDLLDGDSKETSVSGERKSGEKSSNGLGQIAAVGSEEEKASPKRRKKKKGESSPNKNSPQRILRRDLSDCVDIVQAIMDEIINNKGINEDELHLVLTDLRKRMKKMCKVHGKSTREVETADNDLNQEVQFLRNRVDELEEMLHKYQQAQEDMDISTRAEQAGQDTEETTADDETSSANTSIDDVDVKALTALIGTMETGRDMERRADKARIRYLEQILREQERLIASPMSASSPLSTPRRDCSVASTPRRKRQQTPKITNSPNTSVQVQELAYALECSERQRAQALQDLQIEREFYAAKVRQLQGAFRKMVGQEFADTSPMATSSND